MEQIVDICKHYKRDKNSFDFTMNWAKSDNTLIKI